MGRKVSYRRPGTTQVPLRPGSSGNALRYPDRDRTRTSTHPGANATSPECTGNALIPLPTTSRRSPGLNSPYPTYTYVSTILYSGSSKFPLEQNLSRIPHKTYSSQVMCRRLLENIPLTGDSQQLWRSSLAQVTPQSARHSLLSGPYCRN